MINECIWSLELLTWDLNPPLFALRHLKICLMSDFLLMRWRGQKGPWRSHDLDQEASEASLECRIQLNRQGRLRWLRAQRWQWAELSVGLDAEWRKHDWFTELAPRPFSALEEPGMSLGKAAFLGTLPVYWLLVTAQLGPDMWNLKHNFSKVLSYG